MRKISLTMAVLMFLSGSGFVTNAYGNIMQPTPITDGEAHELDFSEDLAGPGVANVCGGDGNNSMTTALAAIGILALIGVLIAANADEEE